jgi:hypothetical protein
VGEGVRKLTEGGTAANGAAPRDDAGGGVVHAEKHVYAWNARSATIVLAGIASASAEKERDDRCRAAGAGIFRI